jgi:hypothetical protein
MYSKLELVGGSGLRDLVVLGRTCLPTYLVILEYSRFGVNEKGNEV